MRQSKLDSFIEAATNTAIGYAITLVSGLVVYPLMGIEMSFQTMNGIVLWFTVISIVRQYSFRRMFDRLSPGRWIMLKLGYFK